MTNREDIVTVKSTDGSAIAFSAGQRHSLKLAAGEIADKWADGSPITRAEFENVLAPHGPFEIAGETAGEFGKFAMPERTLNED